MVFNVSNISNFKAENGDLLGELVKSAVDHHVEFRRFKYFPLDPNYVTPYIKEQKSYKEAEDTIRVELEELSCRLNNSVPFFNFRSQVRKKNLIFCNSKHNFRGTCCGTQP